MAETPDYESDEDPGRRWTVRTNDVWIDTEQSRIEIYRQLDRILHRPGSKPLRENREWRFRIVFLTEPEPTVTFTSRGFEVPSHAQDEADRFFEDVRAILEGATPVEDLVTPPPTTEPERPADETEIIDIESLEPGGGG